MPITTLYSLLTLAEVGWKAAHEMNTLTSGRECESSGAPGSSAPVSDADRDPDSKLGAQAGSGSSIRSQSQGPNDGRSNSGEHSTIS